MGFVRQRDIIRKKKDIAELEKDFMRTDDEFVEGMLIQAKRDLKRMLEQNKSYEAMFKR